MDTPSDQVLQEEISQLSRVLEGSTLPPELDTKIEMMLQRLRRAVSYGGYSEAYERVSHYLQWIARIPWSIRSQDILDIQQAKQVLDTHHYGLEDIKERLLEYLAVLQLHQQQGSTDHISRAPILLLVGLVGTGKTTFAKSLAEAMGRSFVRIPFGGMGSARDLRGQSRMHPEAEPGYLIKSLVRAGTTNPVVLLDEIDRVSEQARADIMGVLVELLDPEQNSQFIDHYIDFPIDLSQVLFIGTANNTKHIATAVMDRMEPISMPSYTDEEKITIAQRYLLPKIMQESALPEGVIQFTPETWPKIVRPLGYDSGIRTLQRTLKGVVRKVAKLYVQDNSTRVTLTQENVADFLPSYKTELI